MPEAGDRLLDWTSRVPSPRRVVAKASSWVPAIQRRDRRIQHLSAELDSLNRVVEELGSQLHDLEAEHARFDDLSKASYRQSVRQYVRVFRREGDLRRTPLSSALQLPNKLRNMELAASHGIDVPQVYDVWASADDIDLSRLPDSFVLKADGGAGSKAVFPLERVDAESYRSTGDKKVYHEADLRDRLKGLGPLARRPYFAEELLTAPDGGPIPDDVKFYMFYGEVGNVMLRHVGRHGVASSVRVKFVNEDGQDLGAVGGGRRHDPAIRVPKMLPDMVLVARHLSRAVGLPFCRVDLYETSRGVVMGEITRAPNGGNARFTAAHDELLGQCWINGAASLEADLAAGRPPGQVFGLAAGLRLYPPDERPRAAANFGRQVVECEQWCVERGADPQELSR